MAGVDGQKNHLAFDQPSAACIGYLWKVAWCRPSAEQTIARVEEVEERKKKQKNKKER